MITLSVKNWSMKDIDTVLFDKDGTLIDLDYFWGQMTLLRAEAVVKYLGLNSNLVDKLAYLLGYDVIKEKMIPDGITALYSRSKIIDIFRNSLLELDIAIENAEIESIFDEVSANFYKNMQIYIKPISEAIDFVRKIKNIGVKTGIVTSDSIVSTNLTIVHLGWESLFDIVIGRESSNYSKESGIPTQIALNELNSEPEKTVMIGDAPMDYLSASNANIPNTILVATGQLSTSELLKTCGSVVNSLNDIVITSKL